MPLIHREHDAIGETFLSGDVDFRADEGFLCKGFVECVEGTKEHYENILEQIDERDIWNSRYYEGVIYALDRFVSYLNHYSFDRLISVLESMLSDADTWIQDINGNNAYWVRFFDGWVQIVTSVKKESEKLRDAITQYTN